jgi:hypothetical protein
VTAVAFLALSSTSVIAVLCVMCLRLRPRRHRRSISRTGSPAAETGIRRLAGIRRITVPVDALSDDEVSRRFERIVRIEWAA